MANTCTMSTYPYLGVLIFLVVAACGGLANSTSIPLPTLPSKVPPLPSLLFSPPPPPPYHPGYTPPPPPPYDPHGTPPPPYYPHGTPPPDHPPVVTPSPPPPCAPHDPPPPDHPPAVTPPPDHPPAVTPPPDHPPAVTPSPPPPYNPHGTPPPPPIAKSPPPPPPYNPHGTPPPPPIAKSPPPPPPPKYPPSPPYKYIVTGKLVCSILSNYNQTICKMLPSLCPGISGVPVYVNCGPTRTTIAQGLTDSNGYYNIPIPPSFNVYDCVASVKMPIKSCRLLPRSGNLEAAIDRIISIDYHAMKVQFGTGPYVHNP